MNMRKSIIILYLLFASMQYWPVKAQNSGVDDRRFITYIAYPKTQEIKLYWNDQKGKHFGSIKNLKSALTQKSRKLIFAMNAGMYQTDHSPLGLYIENGKVLSPLNTRSGTGNFYMKPNGIFCITWGDVPLIANSAGSENINKKIKCATQSGPMLVIDGHINPAFREGSVNLNIRNGVGILPGNKVVFVMSQKEINFYDFAAYFKSLGCMNALYLDGFVSRTYLPEKNSLQLDGDFGVIIGISEQVH